LNELSLQSCLSKNVDWWSYTFCYKKHVEQYHAEAVEVTDARKKDAPAADGKKSQEKVYEWKVLSSFTLGMYPRWTDPPSKDALRLHISKNGHWSLNYAWQVGIVHITKEICGFLIKLFEMNIISVRTKCDGVRS